MVLFFLVCVFCFFFFKQKTAYEMRISDWSSDVCSSDLHEEQLGESGGPRQRHPGRVAARRTDHRQAALEDSGGQREDEGEVAELDDHWDAPPSRHWPEAFSASTTRSEERRVGTACVSTCRSRCSPHHLKNKTNNTHTLR